MNRYINPNVIENYFLYGVHVPSRTLYLGDADGEVDAASHELFIKGLTLLDSLCKDSIIIHLNTLGGDWYHGMGMYDAISACRSHVTIIVLGHAVSMGSLILQAADERILGKHSVLMIHDGTETITSDCRSVEAWAAKTKETRFKMYRVYRDRIKEKKPRFTLKQVEALCAHDRIFDPKEAIEYGLADTILEKLPLNS